jgi:hypothetical protein
MEEKEGKMTYPNFDIQDLYNCFDPILETNAVLNDVVYYIDDIAGTIDVIKFIFSNKNKEFSIYIKVNCDYDTIEINNKLFNNSICYRLFTPKTLWSDVIGKKIIWVWQIKNQQGYTDGIQIEFQGRTIIQIIAIASCLYTKNVIEVQEINNECRKNMNIIL